MEPYSVLYNDLHGQKKQKKFKSLKKGGYMYMWASQLALVVKNTPAMQETPEVQI